MHAPPKYGAQIVPTRGQLFRDAVQYFRFLFLNDAEHRTHDLKSEDRSGGPNSWKSGEIADR